MTAIIGDQPHKASIMSAFQPVLINTYATSILCIRCGAASKLEDSQELHFLFRLLDVFRFVQCLGHIRKRPSHLMGDSGVVDLLLGTGSPPRYNSNESIVRSTPSNRINARVIPHRVCPATVRAREPSEAQKNGDVQRKQNC